MKPGFYGPADVAGIDYDRDLGDPGTYPFTRGRRVAGHGRSTWILRELSGEDILAGSVYQSLLEARERKPDVPVVPQRTADFIFIRYIGHPEIESNSLYLKEWGDYVIQQLREGADVYMFCHSPNNFAAPFLCRKVYAQVEKEVDIPPLPWNDLADEDYEQGQLL